MLLLERIKDDGDPLLRDDFHLLGVTSLLERINFFCGDTSCQQRTSDDILMMNHGLAGTDSDNAMLCYDELFTHTDS